MKVYLVGGAIRDRLLGLPVKEHDWVVVGASPEQMLAAGYRPVGKDFPVFLHPETQEEYALARTERKVQRGYHGFVFHTDETVTLAQDLQRRDLTINAIAEDQDGTLIDPFDGQADLKQRCFRHVSPAFVEDPVRILRLARFAAKLPDFDVATETLTLMRSMVDQGEVDALVAERVWQECHRAFSEPAPGRFFDVLIQCGALPRLFPMLSLNTLSWDALSRAVTATDDPVIRFAALMHTSSKMILTKLTQRYRLPKQFTDLAQLCIQCATPFIQFDQLPASERLSLIQQLDALRRTARCEQFIDVMTFCAPEDITNRQAAALRASISALQAVDIPAIIASGTTGPDLPAEIKRQHIAALEDLEHN